MGTYTAKLGALLTTLCVGWVFILWANNFHITAAVAIVCIGYLAIVATIFNLWRTGAAVAVDDTVQGAWDRPIGRDAELEKEKRTLLKAIKEAEFDFAMGKLSQHDSEALIQVYRARAIEIIKALDRQNAGLAMSPRDQIRSEVNARIALAERVKAAKHVKKGIHSDDAKGVASDASATAEDAKAIANDAGTARESQ